MVILLRTHSIQHDVPDQLAISLARSIEPETHLHELILQIPVYSLRAPDHCSLAVVFLEVLSKQASVRVRVIASNHNKTIQLQALAILKTLLELLFRLDLVSPRLNHIEPASILEVINDVVLQLHVLPRVNTNRTFQEPEKLTVWVSLLYLLVKTHDHIVTTSSLSSRKNASNS